MNSRNLNELLGVDWFDGLLIKSAHLDHIDRRVDRLVSWALVASVELPGLIWLDEAPPASPGLIAIRKWLRKEAVVEVEYEILRSFVAMTHHFSIIGVKGSLGNDLPAVQSFIKVQIPIIALQEPQGVLIGIQGTSEPNREISLDERSNRDVFLRRPRLVSFAFSIASLLQVPRLDLPDVVPVARLIVDGDTPKIVTDYIPPLCNLGLLAALNNGSCTNILAAFDGLMQIIKSNIEKGGGAYAAGRVDANFMSRRSDYEILRAILLAACGIVRDINRLSPRQFLWQIAQPVAAWWNEHQLRHFPLASQLPAEDPINIATSAAHKLLLWGLTDLTLGTNQVIQESVSLFEALNEVLRTGS